MTETAEMTNLINSLPAGRDIERPETGEVIRIANIQEIVREAVALDNSLDAIEKFQEAIDACDNVKDEQTIYAIYLRTLKYFDKFKNAEKVLLEVYHQLGIRETDNPFTAFLNKYFDDVDNNLNASNIAMLFNLLAKDILDDNDIKGTSEEGKDNICYNPNIYNIKRDDAEFIISAYKWLSENYNLSKMNLGAIVADEELNSEIKDGIASLTDDEKKNIKNIRDKIIFKDGISGRSHLNERKYIERALNDASNKIGMSSETVENKVKRIMRDILELSTDERTALIRALTGEEE